MPKDFGKNLAKSFMGNVPEAFFKAMFPDTADDILKNKKDMKEAFIEASKNANNGKFKLNANFIKDFLSNNETVNEVTKLGKDTSKSILEDIRSGNWFGNKAKEDKAMNDMVADMFGLDSDDLFGDDAGLGVSDEDFADYSDSSSESAGEFSFETNNDNDFNINDNRSNITNITNIQNNRADGKLLAGVSQQLLSCVGVVSGQIQTINDFHAESVSPIVEKADSFFDQTLELLSSINDGIHGLKKEDDKSSTENIFDELFTASGILNFSVLKDIFKKNLKESSGMNMVEEFLPMAKGFLGNPLRMVTDLAVQNLMPEFITDITKNFEKNLPNLTKSLMLQISEGRNGKGGRLQRLLGKFFGINLSAEKADTSFKNEAVPFDSKTKKTITDIIPTYLGKILNTVESIAKSKDIKINNDSEMIFDWETNQFKTNRVIKANKKEKEFNNLKSDMSPILDLLKEIDDNDDNSKSKNGLSNVERQFLGDSQAKKLAEYDSLYEQKTALDKQISDLEKQVRKTHDDYKKETEALMKKEGSDEYKDEYKELEKRKAFSKQRESKFHDENKESIRTQNLKRAELLMQRDKLMKSSGTIKNDMTEDFDKFVVNTLDGFIKANDGNALSISQVLGNKAALTRLMNSSQVSMKDLEKLVKMANSVDGGIQAINSSQVDRVINNNARAKSQTADSAPLFTENYDVTDVERRKLDNLNNGKFAGATFRKNGGTEQQAKDEILAAARLMNEDNLSNGHKTFKQMLGDDKSIGNYITTTGKYLADNFSRGFSDLIFTDNQGKTFKEGMLDKFKKSFDNFLTTSDIIPEKIKSKARKRLEKEKEAKIKREIENYENGKELLGVSKEFNENLIDFAKSSGSYNEKLVKDLEEIANAGVREHYSIHTDSARADALLAKLVTHFTGEKINLDSLQNNPKSEIRRLSKGEIREQKRKKFASNSLKNVDINRKLIDQFDNDIINESFDNYKLDYKAHEKMNKYAYSTFNFDIEDIEKYLSKEYEKYLKNTRETVDDSIGVMLKKALNRVIVYPLKFMIMGKHDDKINANDSLFSVIKQKLELTILPPIKRKFIGKDKDRIKEDSSLFKIAKDKINYNILDPLKDQLLGPVDAEGKRTKIPTFIKENEKELKRMGISTGVGGLLGLFFTHPLLGAGIGMFTATNKFREEMFGDSNDSVKNRIRQALIGTNKDNAFSEEDSFLDVLAKRMQISIIEPTKERVKTFLFGNEEVDGVLIRIGTSFSNWLEKHEVFDKLHDSLTIIGKEIIYDAKLMFKRTFNYLIRTVTNVFKSVTNFFKENVINSVKKAIINSSEKDGSFLNRARERFSNMAAMPINKIASVKEKVREIGLNRFRNSDGSIDWDSAKEAGFGHLNPNDPYNKAKKRLSEMRLSRFDSKIRGKESGFTKESIKQQSKLVKDMKLHPEWFNEDGTRKTEADIELVHKINTKGTSKDTGVIVQAISGINDTLVNGISYLLKEIVDSLDPNSPYAEEVRKKKKKDEEERNRLNPEIKETVVKKPSSKVPKNTSVLDKDKNYNETELNLFNKAKEIYKNPFVIKALKDSANKDIKKYGEESQEGKYAKELLELSEKDPEAFLDKMASLEVRKLRRFNLRKEQFGEISDEERENIISQHRDRSIDKITKESLKTKKFDKKVKDINKSTKRSYKDALKVAKTNQVNKVTSRIENQISDIDKKLKDKALNENERESLETERTNLKYKLKHSKKQAKKSKLNSRVKDNLYKRYMVDERNAEYEKVNEEFKKAFISERQRQEKKYNSEHKKSSILSNKEASIVRQNARTTFNNLSDKELAKLSSQGINNIDDFIAQQIKQNENDKAQRTFDNYRASKGKLNSGHRKLIEDKLIKEGYNKGSDLFNEEVENRLDNVDFKQISLSDSRSQDKKVTDNVITRWLDKHKVADKITNTFETFKIVGTHIMKNFFRLSYKFLKKVVSKTFGFVGKITSGIFKFIKNKLFGKKGGIVGKIFSKLGAGIGHITAAPLTLLNGASNLINNIGLKFHTKDGKFDINTFDPERDQKYQAHLTKQFIKKNIDKDTGNFNLKNALDKSNIDEDTLKSNYASMTFEKMSKENKKSIRRGKGPIHSQSDLDKMKEMMEHSNWYRQDEKTGEFVLDSGLKDKAMESVRIKEAENNPLQDVNNKQYDEQVKQTSILQSIFNIVAKLTGDKTVGTDNTVKAEKEKVNNALKTDTATKVTENPAETVKQKSSDEQLQEKIEEKEKAETEERENTISTAITETSKNTAEVASNTGGFKGLFGKIFPVVMTIATTVTSFLKKFTLFRKAFDLVNTVKDKVKNGVKRSTKKAISKILNMGRKDANGMSYAEYLNLATEIAKQEEAEGKGFGGGAETYDQRVAMLMKTYTKDMPDNLFGKAKKFVQKKVNSAKKFLFGSKNEDNYQLTLQIARDDVEALAAKDPSAFPDQESKDAEVMKRVMQNKDLWYENGILTKAKNKVIGTAKKIGGKIKNVLIGKKNEEDYQLTLQIARDEVEALAAKDPSAFPDEESKNKEVMKRVMQNKDLWYENGILTKAKNKVVGMAKSLANKAKNGILGLINGRNEEDYQIVVQTAREDIEAIAAKYPSQFPDQESIDNAVIKRVIRNKDLYEKPNIISKAKDMIGEKVNNLAAKVKNSVTSKITNMRLKAEAKRQLKENAANDADIAIKSATNKAAAVTTAETEIASTGAREGKKTIMEMASEKIKLLKERLVGKFGNVIDLVRRGWGAAEGVVGSIPVIGPPLAMAMTPLAIGGVIALVMKAIKSFKSGGKASDLGDGGLSKATSKAGKGKSNKSGDSEQEGGILGFGGGILGKVLEPFKKIFGIVEKLVEPLGDILSTSMELLSPFGMITDLLDDVTEPIGEVVDSIKESVKPIIETVKSTLEFVNPLKFVVDYMKRFMKPIQVAFKVVGAIIKPLTKVISLINKFTNPIKTATSLFKKLTSPLKALSKIISKLTGGVKGVVKGAVDKVKGVAKGIKDKITGVKDKITGGAKGAVNKLKSGVSSLKDKIFGTKKKEKKEKKSSSGRKPFFEALKEVNKPIKEKILNKAKEDVSNANSKTEITKIVKKSLKKIDDTNDRNGFISAAKERMSKIVNGDKSNSTTGKDKRTFFEVMKEVTSPTYDDARKSVTNAATNKDARSVATTAASTPLEALNNITQLLSDILGVNTDIKSNTSKIGTNNNQPQQEIPRQQIGNEATNIFNPQSNNLNINNNTSNPSNNQMTKLNSNTIRRAQGV